MDTVYEGERVQSGSVRVTVDGKPLGLRLDLRKHSPTGFEWGYGGSGPAQLALAVTAHALGDDEKALAVYQTVKGTLFAGIAGDKWRLSGDAVRSVAERAYADHLERCARG